MSDWILGVLRSGGYTGLTLLAALECLFLPLPSELIFPMAGYLVAQDQLAFGWCVLAGAGGNVVGSLPLFGLGRRLGSDGVRAVVERHRRWTAVTPDELARAERWFDRYGSWAVLAAHLVPGLRALIAFPAGIRKMSVLRFVVLTFVGAAVWAGLLVAGGMALRENFAEIEHWIDPISWAVVGGTLGMYFWRVLRPARAHPR